MMKMKTCLPMILLVFCMTLSQAVGRDFAFWRNSKYQETLSLDAGQSIALCGGSNGHWVGHCMKYDYSSDRLVESYVVEKNVYEAITDEGDPMSEKEMIRGSQCLAEECEKKVEVDDGAWCLVMTNLDEDFQPTNITLHYEGCLSSNDKDMVLIILAGTVGGLLLLLCTCACISCLCLCSNKKQKKQGDQQAMTATVQYHPDMGWYVPPTPQEVYPPEMCMQQVHYAPPRA